MDSRSWALLSSHRLLDNCLSWVLVKSVFCLLIHTQSDVFWVTVHGMVSILVCLVFMAPWWYGSKEPTCQGRRLKRHGFDPRVGKIPWRSKWQPTLIFLPGKSHGQRNLVGFSPWGCKESDMTEWACMHALMHNIYIYIVQVSSTKFWSCLSLTQYENGENILWKQPGSFSKS